MTDRPIYRTHLSAEARRRLILNGGGAVLLSLLSGWQWWSGAHWFHAVIFCIMAPLAVLVIVTLLRSRHPLEVFSDRIVLNSIARTALPLANIEGIGTHPKRREPSLIYRHEGTVGDIAIHWRFIREPQEDVLAEIEAALGRAG